jgi:hypothetical protein
MSISRIFLFFVATLSVGGGCTFERKTDFYDDPERWTYLGKYSTADHGVEFTPHVRSIIFDKGGGNLEAGKRIYV